MTASQAAPESWSDIDKDVVKEVVRQAELQIQHQALTAQSLDQRATSIAALANAGAVAVIVFVVSHGIKNEIPASVAFGAVAIAAAWFASAWCALRALRPGPWLSAGTWPHQWYGLLRQKEWKQEELLGAIAEQLEDNCRRNHDRNIIAARALKKAIWIGMLSPLFGLISFSVGPQAWQAVRAAKVAAAEIARSGCY